MVAILSGSEFESVTDQGCFEMDESAFKFGHFRSLHDASVDSAV